MFFAPVLRTRAMSPSFRSFDRSFERFVNDAFFANPARGFDVQEDDKAWTVTLDLPGVAREDLSVNI
jgi:HSP20 family molecular chaperone IbpA